MATTNPVYKVGQKVSTADGKHGIIRYIGELEGKAGTFIGIELEEALGKNDGSVEGKSYFECGLNHGIFYRSTAALTVVSQPVTSSSSTANASSGRGEVPSARGPAAGGVAARTRVSGVSGPAAVKSRPSVAPGGSSRVGGSTGAVAAARPSNVAPRRLSTAPSATSSAASSRASSRPSLAPANGSPKKPAPSSRLSSISGASSRQVRSPVTATATARNSVASSRNSTIRSPTERSEASGARTPPPTIEEIVAENEETPKPSAQARTAGLQERRRQMEAQRTEATRVTEREMAKELEQARERSEQFERVNEKLQTKCKTQSEEIRRLKQVLLEREQLCERLEKLNAEHDTFMEDAVLDKEMAEEREMGVRHELEILRQTHEAMDEDFTRMKEQYEEMSKDMTPEERANQGWLHMERENNRLKQALLLLRDRTLENETDFRIRIEELETDNEELNLFKGEAEESKVKVLEAEAQIEDLREQLEVAEGAEAMIEQLTDRNAVMTERLEELQTAVSDLQDLKEIHDEIEDSYNEQVKELEMMINSKDLAIQDFTTRIVQQKEDMDDQELTIAKFRELVEDLQLSMDDMRASKELTETQAQDLENHHRNMMDFNRQLQASASSHKLKTIDLELRKFEADEAAEQLAIVQLFLPEAYQAERGSVLVYLGFKRIAFKARLLHTLLKENIARYRQHGSAADRILTTCDALDRLTWISAVSDRFVSTMSRCSLDEFAKFESTMYDLEPVERTLNAFIEETKNDQLREAAVVNGLQRSTAVYEHLVDIHFSGDVADFADEMLMKTMVMYGRLENITTALAVTRQEMSSVASGLVEEDEDAEISSSFSSRAEAFSSMAKGAKVISGKVFKQLQELVKRAMTLDDRTQPSFNACAETTEGISLAVRTLALGLQNLVHAESRDSPVNLNEILDFFHSFNSSTFHTAPPNPWDPLTTQLQRIHIALSQLYNTTLDLSLSVEIETRETPWAMRSRIIQENKIISVDAQEEIQALKREMQNRQQALVLRDQALEELSLKAEMLEARNKESAKKVNRVVDLEAAVQSEQAISLKARQQIKASTAQIQRLTEERDSWMRKAAEALPSSSTTNHGSNGADGHMAKLVGTSAEMDSLRGEIKALQETTRYLRGEVRRVRMKEDTQKNSWLSIPLLTKPDADLAQKRRDQFAALEKLASLPETAKPLLLRPFVDDSIPPRHQSSKPSAMEEVPDQAEKKQDQKERKRLAWRPEKMTARWHLSEIEMTWLETIGEFDEVVGGFGGDDGVGAKSHGFRRKRDRGLHRGIWDGGGEVIIERGQPFALA